MVYLIDSSIYIFRAWQTLPSSLRNRYGEPVNAVFGFANTLAQIIEHKQPHYMVCAFDQSFRQGIRNEIYPPYKADRPPAPPELNAQFSRCIDVARAMGIPSFGSTRVEADDIIGQLADVAHKAGQQVTIVSADKDLAQFIETGDIYWNLSRKQRYDRLALYRRFKVQTNQIADWLALCGDKVDNIPGVPGVGPATAAKLLSKWGTLETLMDNIEGVATMRFRGAPRVSELLREHSESIQLARKLTGLIADPDIPSTIASMRRELPNRKTLLEQLMSTGLNQNHCAQLAARVDNSNN